MSSASADDPIRRRAPIETGAALRLLADAELDVLGRMPQSSNATFLVDLVDAGDVPAQAIYKPERGERPLWDFPDCLYRREIAAYELSEHLGWGHVPPTIERDGPLGIGSLQLFIPADFQEHYFTLMEEPEHVEALMEICAFDLVANNTDRKSGHVLLGDDGALWAIDNGLSFHAEFKVRTVIWDFAGEHLPPHVRSRLLDFAGAPLPDSIAPLLDTFERDALLTRARVLAQEGVFPHDPTGRRYPWPMV